ncbi:helix-turn-helix domain-containing protein [Sphingomonas panni]
MMTPGERIAAAREARGWKRPALAEAMGTSTSQIERLEKSQRRMTTDWLERAAQALGTTLAELMGDNEIAADPAPPPNAEAVRYEGSSMERMQENLPIFGTALGSPRQFDGEAIEQTMLNSGEAIGYLKRPVLLNGRDDVYGLYVHGSSMEPAHMAGSTIIAEMRRPPRIGDDVVVYLRPDGDDDDGHRARAVLVKRLVRRGTNWIDLEQFSPAATFRLEAAQYVRIDRVMTLGELLA